jgi:hypothetical protein
MCTLPSVRRLQSMPALIWTAALLVCGLTLQGQDVRASLTGLITDQSGAPIADAIVSATNIDTQVVSVTKSNTAGSYVILFLLPGHYNVDIKAAGFKQFIRDNLTLSTSEKGTLDIKMEVGAVNQSVEVKAEAPLLETTTASRSNAVTGQQIMDLPNNSRNIYNVILALPGVAKQDANWEQFSNYGLINSTRISINGGVARDNETVIDGVVDTQPDRTVTFQPPLESVAEISVQTSNFDSAYGRFGGGVTAINTKSGTNAMHGSVFEYHTNSALAANSWSRDFQGLPKPEGRENQYGFEIDAPIFVPKLFDGRNRLFFMLSYEGQRVGSQGGGSTVVPTAAMKSGDFSAVPRVIYDPMSTHIVNGQAVRTPFPNNHIPSSLINPVSANLLGYLPAPNLAQTGYGLANYNNTQNSISNYGLWLGRIDYRINERNNIFFSAGKLPYLETDGVLFPNSPADVSSENPLHRNFDRYVIDWTNTLSPTTVLNFRAGYIQYGSLSGNPLAIGFDNRTLGIDPALVAQQRVAQFPRFEIGGFYTALGSTSPLNNSVQDTESYQANVIRSVGRHQLKMGAEFRIYNSDQWSSGYGGGLYQFTKGFTQANPITADAVSGDEFASFLLGHPATGEMDLTIDPAFQNKYWAVFAHDDVRVTKHIALNLGLRWDYETPIEERYNRMLRGFAFDQASPLAPQVPGLMGGLLYAGSSGDSRYASNPDHNNIQPRIGVSAQVAKDWVIRGGYGLYYMATFGGQPTTGFSATTPLVSSADGGLTPLVSLTNAFPGTLTQPVGNSLGLGTNLGQPISFNDVNRKTPYSQQFSFGIQHVLRLGMVAEATYSGNLTSDYPVSVNLNAIPIAQLGMPSSYYTAQVPNPFQGLLPLNRSMNGATVPRQDLLVPYPQFTSVTMNNIPLGKNNYQALQTRLAMRYRNGMTLNLGYTWSKTLEQMSFLNPQDFDLQNIKASKLEKRLAQFDVPQHFTALWTYELPFGHNKALGNGFNGFWDKVISGWQVNLIATLQSGFPATYPNAPSLDPLESAKLPDGQRNLFEAFNTNLFPTKAPNLQYTYRTWPTRFSDVRLMPLVNLDASLSKSTAITEKLHFMFRAEAYNASNTPWFNSQSSGGTDVTQAQFGWYNLSSATNRSITLIGKLIW